MAEAYDPFDPTGEEKSEPVESSTKMSSIVPLDIPLPSSIPLPGTNVPSSASTVSPQAITKRVLKGIHTHHPAPISPPTPSRSPQPILPPYPSVKTRENKCDSKQATQHRKTTNETIDLTGSASAKQIANKDNQTEMTIDLTEDESILKQDSSLANTKIVNITQAQRESDHLKLKSLMPVSSRLTRLDRKTPNSKQGMLIKKTGNVFATQKQETKPAKISFAIKTRFKPLSSVEEVHKEIEEPSEESADESNHGVTKEVNLSQGTPDRTNIQDNQDKREVEKAHVNANKEISSEFQLRKDKTIIGKTDPVFLSSQEVNNEKHNKLDVPKSLSLLYSPTAANSSDSVDSDFGYSKLRSVPVKDHLEKQGKQLVKSNMPSADGQRNSESAVKFVPKQALKSKLSFLTDAFGCVEKKIQEELTEKESPIKVAKHEEILERSKSDSKESSLCANKDKTKVVIPSIDNKKTFRESSEHERMSRKNSTTKANSRSRYSSSSDERSPQRENNRQECVRKKRTNSKEGTSKSKDCNQRTPHIDKRKKMTVSCEESSDEESKQYNLHHTKAHKNNYLHRQAKHKDQSRDEHDTNTSNERKARFIQKDPNSSKRRTKRRNSHHSSTASSSSSELNEGDPSDEKRVRKQGKRKEHITKHSAGSSEDDEDIKHKVANRSGLRQVDAEGLTKDSVQPNQSTYLTHEEKIKARKQYLKQLEEKEKNSKNQGTKFEKHGQVRHSSTENQNLPRESSDDESSLLDFESSIKADNIPLAKDEQSVGRHEEAVALPGEDNEGLEKAKTIHKPELVKRHTKAKRFFSDQPPDHVTNCEAKPVKNTHAIPDKESIVDKVDQSSTINESANQVNAETRLEKQKRKIERKLEIEQQLRETDERLEELKKQAHEANFLSNDIKMSTPSSQEEEKPEIENKPKPVSAWDPDCFITKVDFSNKEVVVKIEKEDGSVEVQVTKPCMKTAVEDNKRAQSRSHSRGHSRQRRRTNSRDRARSDRRKRSRSHSRRRSRSRDRHRRSRSRGKHSRSRDRRSRSRGRRSRSRGRRSRSRGRRSRSRDRRLRSREQHSRERRDRDHDRRRRHRSPTPDRYRRRRSRDRDESHRRHDRSSDNRIKGSSDDKLKPAENRFSAANEYSATNEPTAAIDLPANLTSIPLPPTGIPLPNAPGKPLPNELIKSSTGLQNSTSATAVADSTAQSAPPPPPPPPAPVELSQDSDIESVEMDESDNVQEHQTAAKETNPLKGVGKISLSFSRKVAPTGIAPVQPLRSVFGEDDDKQSLSSLPKTVETGSSHEVNEEPILDTPLSRAFKPFGDPLQTRYDSNENSEDQANSLQQRNEQYGSSNPQTPLPPVTELSDNIDAPQFPVEPRSLSVNIETANIPPPQPVPPPPESATSSGIMLSPGFRTKAALKQGSMPTPPAVQSYIGQPYTSGDTDIQPQCVQEQVSESTSSDKGDLVTAPVQVQALPVRKRWALMENQEEMKPVETVEQSPLLVQNSFGFDTTTISPIRPISSTPTAKPRTRKSRFGPPLENSEGQRISVITNVMQSTQLFASSQVDSQSSSYSYDQSDVNSSQLDSSTVSSSGALSTVYDPNLTSDKDMSVTSSLNDSQAESDAEVTLKNTQADESELNSELAIEADSKSRDTDQDEVEIKAGNRGRRKNSKKSSSSVAGEEAAPDTEASSETPTRRRSTRIKQQVVEKKVKDDDKPNKEEQKKGKRGRKKKEENGETLAEDSNAESIIATPTNPGVITIKQVTGMKDEFLLPDNVPRRGEEFNSPTPAFASPSSGSSPVSGSMKLKSRWRRCSELESKTDAIPATPGTTPPYVSETIPLNANPVPAIQVSEPNTQDPSTDASLPPLPDEADDVYPHVTQSENQENTSAEQPENPAAADEIVMPLNGTNDIAVNKEPAPPAAPAVVEPPKKPPQFEYLLDSVYLCERKKTKAQKEAKRMVCDCTLPSNADQSRGIMPCGEDCLNRMLMIECGSRCPCGEYCTNKRFQRDYQARLRHYHPNPYVHQYGPVETYFTGNKGYGIRATKDMTAGEFIIEYVGEVLDHAEFQRRARSYDKNQHYYFMALNADEIVDATYKGNVSRFTNHSCDPVAETQKWTVNGQLRIGFFTIKDVKAGDEVTFDYQYENYGQEAQTCHCGAANCRGTLGKVRQVREGLPLDESCLDLFSSDTAGEGGVVKEERRKKKKKKASRIFDDILLREEIDSLIALGGLLRREHVLELSRLMVRAESVEHRTALLQVLQDTKEPNCLRLFLDYQGLQLLWSWMVDMPPDAIDLKMQVLKTLKLLPINNRTILKESKILGMVTKWASKDITTLAALENRTPKLTDPLSLNFKNEFKPLIKSESKADLKPTENEAAIKLENEIKDEVSAEPDKEEPIKSDVKPLVEDEVEMTRATEDAVEKEPLKETAIDDVTESTQPSTPGASMDDSTATGETTPDITSNPLSHFMNKKRRLLQSVNDEGGSDSDASESAKTKTAENQLKSQVEAVKMEDMETEASMASSDERCLDTSQDGSEMGQENLREGLIQVIEFAAELLKSWKDLKEQFKIPKIKVEERKKREREMEQKETERGYKREGHGYESRSWRDRKRHAESPDRRSGDEKKRRQSDADPRDRFNKVLTPTQPRGPKMSKEEHRKLFELQVKAEDQIRKLQEEQEQQAQQAQQQQQQGIYADPVYTPFYQQPTGNESAYPPFVPDPHQSYASDPNQPGLQMVLQPDGTYLATASHTPTNIAAPATSSTHPQPVVIDTAVAQATNPQAVYSQQAAATTQYVDPANPQVVYQTTTNTYQTQYATSGPPGVTYVQPASQPVQVQQVYYQTPQGQVIVQQQPVATTQVVQQVPAHTSQLIHVTSHDQVQQLTQLQPHTIAVQPEQPKEPPPPPPLPPPKPKTVRLPPNWKTAKDSDGKMYYYHTVTRQTQWDPPEWESGTPDDSVDVITPIYDEPVKPKKKEKANTASADSSSETAKKNRDAFRSKMSKHIIKYLGPFRRSDCKMGRITSDQDFKHLARKLTHAVLEKELKYCRHVDDLEVNESVRNKAKDFVKKYMHKCGPQYKGKGEDSPVM